MHYLGIDIIEITRIEEAVSRWGGRFLQRVYTDNEIRLYREQISSLAARFAAKEAVVKALSPRNSVISLKEIEIINDPGGQPRAVLHGRARQRAQELGINNLDISLSHCREYAVACAIDEK
jgi:holo-[acyl-carrier protein] synthase